MSEAPTTAADTYAALYEAATEQFRRVLGPVPEDMWGGRAPQGFTMDPHRALDGNMQVVASYVSDGDTLIDVGGGAGRVCLPFAQRCREVVNIDPSPAMGDAFLACAQSAGIKNARFVEADWVKAEGVRGDVCIAAHVTYFVRDIVPFVERLEAAAKRRVMIIVGAVPPPNQVADAWRLVYREEHAPVPGHKELLAVLWEMGILPEVRVLPNRPFSERELPKTREDALRGQLGALVPEWAPPRLDAAFRERAQGILDEHFDELVEETPRGFRRRLPDARELLITWESR